MHKGQSCRANEHTDPHPAAADTLLQTKPHAGFNPPATISSFMHHEGSGPKGRAWTLKITTMARANRLPLRSCPGLLPLPLPPCCLSSSASHAPSWDAAEDEALLPPCLRMSAASCMCAPVPVRNTATELLCWSLQAYKQAPIR